MGTQHRYTMYCIVFCIMRIMYRFIGKVPAVIQFCGVHRKVFLAVLVNQKPHAKFAVCWHALLGILVDAALVGVCVVCVCAPTTHR